MSSSASSAAVERRHRAVALDPRVLQLGHLRDDPRRTTRWCAKSYMNHEKPQSSKSITRTSAPSTSRLASRMSACTSPNRSGPLPYALEPRPQHAVQPSQQLALRRGPCPARPASGPSAPRRRVSCRTPRRTARTRPGRCHALACPCMRAETAPSVRNAGTRSRPPAPACRRTATRTAPRSARPARRSAPGRPRCRRPGRRRVRSRRPASSRSASIQASSESISLAVW